MQRATEKRHVTADRLTACKTGYGLVDYGLENGSSQIFLGCPVIDEGLDIRLGKYTASGSYCVQTVVILCIFVKSGSVSHEQRGHLVDE